MSAAKVFPLDSEQELAARKAMTTAFLCGYIASRTGKAGMDVGDFSGHAFRAATFAVAVVANEMYRAGLCGLENFSPGLFVEVEDARHLRRSLAAMIRTSGGEEKAERCVQGMMNSFRAWFELLEFILGGVETEPEQVAAIQQIALSCREAEVRQAKGAKE